MFMDLWKPTHQLLGTIVKHSAVDAKVNTVQVVLRAESRLSVEDKGPRR